MLQIKVKPLDRHNPEGVLELLNSYKNNLSTLLLQYNTIIETYIEILGISEVGLANINEVILPEIEYLLSKYDCEFTKSGIYSNGKEIFSVSPNTKEPTIKIKDGENSCQIVSTIITNGEKGLMVNKNIRDFSNLDENVKKNLSVYASFQLDTPSIHDSFCFPLNSITINSVIAAGVECLKTVKEYYKNDMHNPILLYQCFRLNANNPTMHYQQTLELPDDLSKETLDQNAIEIKRYTKEGKKLPSRMLFGEQQELMECLHRCNSIPYNCPNINKKLFYYGETKLHYNAENIVHEPARRDNPFRTSHNLGYEDKIKISKQIPINNSDDNDKLYDVFNLLGYSKLINNLRTYDKKYPHSVHPLYLYMRDWKGNLGKFLKEYFNAMYDLYKTQDD